MEPGHAPEPHAPLSNQTSLSHHKSPFLVDEWITVWHAVKAKKKSLLTPRHFAHCRLEAVGFLNSWPVVQCQCVLFAFFRVFVFTAGLAYRSHAGAVGFLRSHALSATAVEPPAAGAAGAADGATGGGGGWAGRQRRSAVEAAGAGRLGEREGG